MKTQKMLGSTLLAVIAVVVLLNGNSFAQNNHEEVFNQNKGAVQNLIDGIKSENLGVKKSAIYYAGLYKVQGTLFALMSELRNSDDANTRILIGKSLQRIGDSRGIYMLQAYSRHDSDAKVRNMFTYLYNVAELERQGYQLSNTGEVIAFTSGK